MKGFLIFLGVTLLLMGIYLYYNIKHPQETIIVRKGAYWITLDHNVSIKETNMSFPINTKGPTNHK